MSSVHGTAGEHSRQWRWDDSVARTPPGDPVAPETDDGWLTYWRFFYECKVCGATLPGYGQRRFDPEREAERCDFCDERARAAYHEQQRDVERWQRRTKAGRKSRFTDAEQARYVARARAFKDQGLTWPQIAARLELPQTTIYTWHRSRDFP